MHVKVVEYAAAYKPKHNHQKVKKSPWMSTARSYYMSKSSSTPLHTCQKGKTSQKIKKSYSHKESMNVKWVLLHVKIVERAAAYTSKTKQSQKLKSEKSEKVQVVKCAAVHTSTKI